MTSLGQIMKFESTFNSVGQIMNSESHFGSLVQFLKFEPNLNSVSQIMKFESGYLGYWMVGSWVQGCTLKRDSTQAAHARASFAAETGRPRSQMVTASSLVTTSTTSSEAKAKAPSKRSLSSSMEMVATWAHRRPLTPRLH